MNLPWEISLGFPLLAICSVVLMANGVVRLRIAHGKKWVALSHCVWPILLSLGMAAGSFLLSRTMDDLARSFRNAAPPSHLRPDWGADWSKEDRTKHSQMLARLSFEHWGISVQYFDLDGSMLFYKPTDTDRKNREARLRYIARTEQASTWLIWAMFGCFLIPWIGLAAGFMPWSERIFGALTRRSKSDAPTSGARLS